MNETKIFKRFMLRYLLIAFLVVLGCIPFAFMAYKHIRDYTISTNVQKIETGITELEDNIDKMNMVSSMLSEDQNMILLKKSEGQIPADKVLNLKYLANQMFDIHCIYDFSPMFFVLFHSNDAFVSTNQVSDDFMQYYGKFFEVEGMTAAEFKQILFDRERTSPFVYVEQLKYNVTNKEVITKDAVLYVDSIEAGENLTTNKAVIAFIIDPKQLAETLLSKESLNEGVIKIADSSDNIIVNYGEGADKIGEIQESEFLKTDAGTLKLLNYINMKKGLNITVGLPMSQINNQMEDIIFFLLIYAGIGLLVALILTIAFSLHWYMPIRDMVKEAERLGNGSTGKKNEFDYVRESLLKLVSVKDELETKILLADTQKQAIELENIFIKGFYKREDEKKFIDKFPLVKEGYYVAYLQIHSEMDEDKGQRALVLAIELLKQDFLKEFLHVRSMSNTEILLIPALDHMDNETLRKIFLAMQEEITKESDVLCLVGLSQKEREISNINVAYAQARQTVHAYKNMNTSFVQFYQYINDSDKGCFNMSFLNKLYELILCSGKKEIEKMFEEAKEECVVHKERYEFHKEEIYHAISFAYYAATQQLTFIPKEELKLPKYQQNHSLIQFLDILEQSIYGICERIEENKKSKNLELRDRIIKYLEENYRRMDLTADVVSSEVGISEKYLSTFLKEHTGKTFSAYIDEHRIAYSKQCLLNTAWSNEKIAEESGFGAVNTFYRVFKKHTGVSPSVYKKNMMELEK
ncbi:helix-turn-helix domain-containing protein [Konateibacter massiliensis]|uniref:helix-turn-helix domain-containing protein n=1 Tax=Konateibacter massiliensis TaxID=2002841 RepID=UPI0015D4DAFE|nr:AraC family transcriptional regulator [Konateibacter massiliensis]